MLNSHWKDWCWSCNSNTLATWCEELTHWKRPWCWERLKAGGEEDNRGWDGWMASPTQWTWVWACSGSWWWTGKPGVLQSMGLQRNRHDWGTELSWYFISAVNSITGTLIELIPFCVPVFWGYFLECSFIFSSGDSTPFYLSSFLTYLLLLLLLLLLLSCFSRVQLCATP